ncbi:helix-turn-helix domain-containing protein [Fulvivirgaceae bacterium BMA12]|uniref:Helix-turn-helix domain-containing protein n=1 Tax=Agaribacillus aureus TaxID=3051825 RepID=A0ABT8LAM6_9BACT|nr:helix-turn-helix domain-containing protein [Fulvivirgaceae bacterium BMA12]
MDLNFNWINLLILFGALQGLVFSIILLFNKKHPGAIYLSIFMLVLAYNGIETFNWSSGLSDHIIFFDLFPFVMIYALGPSLYLYIHSLLYPEKKRPLKIVLAYYSPPIFQFVFRIVIIGVYLFIVNNVFFTKDQLELLDGIYYSYAEVVSIITFFFYLYLSLRLFIKARASQSIPSVSKEKQQEIYKWVKALLICMVVFGAAWPLTVIASYLPYFHYNASYYPIELALVIFVYWIAIVGYFRVKIISYGTTKMSPNLISTSTAKKLMIQLRQAMENDKLYLNPTLNRHLLSTHTGINAKSISAALNQHSQQNFNDFINDYRVKEVCKKLLSSEKQHLTISGIAFESGFNSQATFQRAFKNTMGMSPKEYLDAQLKKID